MRKWQIVMRPGVNDDSKPLDFFCPSDIVEMFAQTTRISGGECWHFGNNKANHIPPIKMAESSQSEKILSIWLG
jgi:hypothetical protein